MSAGCPPGIPTWPLHHATTTHDLRFKRPTDTFASLPHTCTADSGQRLVARGRGTSRASGEKVVPACLSVGRRVGYNAAEVTCEEARQHMCAFVQVARLEDIAPGELLRVEVAGRLVCLANVDGAIYAVDDDCTHISGPLDQGELEGCVLTCPLHLARFDVRTGQVLRGPARDDLPTYRVRVEGDAIYVAETDQADQAAAE
jgi:3-phenylpropionate/trans-cinnamate dioxygenase ferredoxin component